jgi:flagellar biosynthesis/type III secretory pathway protein FliH
MSFALILDSETPALAALSPLIKADQRQDFIQAADVLTEVRALKAASLAEIDARQASAARDGYARGLAKAEEQIEAMLAEIASQFSAFENQRRDDIAAAAYAAVTAIIGGLDDETVLAKLVGASLARNEDNSPVTVEVTPAMAERIAAKLGDTPHVSVRGNPALGARDCQILSPQGRIVADLSVQMTALAERWGVPGDAA